jgi:predicted permease
MWTRIRSFTRALFRADAIRKEMEDELAFHLESRASDLQRQGLSPQAALRQARIELGSTASIAEDARHARGARAIDEIRQDLRFALRTFARNPSFAAIVIATLALGIGANTAVFSIVNAVLLRPIAAPDPSHIFVFGTARETLPPAGASPTRFNAWRELNSVFQDISAYRYPAMNLTGPGSPQRVQVAQVSEAYFRLFGLSPAQGRTFSPEEDRPNAGGFAVVSDAFASRIVGSDPLGKRILLGGAAHEIIGVLPPGVRTASAAAIDIWIPFQIAPASVDQSHFFTVAGRIRPGVTQAQVQTALSLASDAFAAKFPDIGKQLGGSRFVVRPIQEVVSGDARPALLALLCAVAFVLLIACANVANLLLVRAGVRHREIALRAGLGATRSRLARQLLTETGLLWIFGAAFGVGIGLAGVRVLLALDPGGFPRLGEGIAADWRVFCFAVLASLLTGALFGAYPAVRGSRADLRSSIQRDGTRARSVLVVGQIALALALVIASGLLIRTFFAMRAVDPGFDPRNVLTLQALLADERYSNTDGLTDLVQRSVQSIEAIPAVEAAAAGCCLPIGGQPNVSFAIAGRPKGDSPSPRANIPTVSPNFFAVHRIPLMQGRAFTDADRQHSPRVVVINQALARRDWPGGGALGARITIGSGGVDQHEIVGIIGDVRDRSYGESGPTIYMPLAQSTDNGTAYNVRRPTHWMVRTAGDPALVRDAVKAEIERASGLPVIEAQSMERVVARSTAEPDFRLALMLVFGTLALALAAVGVYGLVSNDVTQRRTEAGVRLALGAQGRDILRLILLRSAKLTFFGLTIGLTAAFALSDVLAGFLFGVEPRDPLAFVASPLVLGAVSLIAAAIPALRASRLEPVSALRHE